MAVFNARRFLAVLAILIPSAFWNAAQAQDVQCYPFDKTIALLEKQAGEVMAGAGVDERGNLVMLLKSPKGGWSFIVRLERNGTVYACPLSSGQGWEATKPKLGEPS